MLVRLGFTEIATRYMSRYAGMDSLKEVAFLDDGDVETLINCVNRPGGTTTVGTGASAVTIPSLEFSVSIRDEANLKLCVFYLRHCMRVTRTPIVTLIDLDLVRVFRDQSKWEENFKKTAIEPMINDKEWPLNMDNIREFMVSIIGDTGEPLAYVIRVDSTVHPEATDYANAYLMVDQEMTQCALYSETAFRNNKRIVWDYMANICHAHK
jgi:hypothetical protein